MEFVTNSEYLINIAYWLSIISFASVVLVIAAILLVRLRTNVAKKRAARIHDVWQPILVACLDGLPEQLPKLEKRDFRTFLFLWNYFHETLRNAGNENLNILARRLALDEWALNALDRGTIREKLLAILTLGWLEEKRAWPKLFAIMKTADPVTSLSAAKALVRIDAREGVEVFLPMVAVTSDWSYAAVGKILKELGAEIVSEPLVRTAGFFEGKDLVRLIRFLGMTYEEQAAPLISRLLRESTDISVLSSCLREVVDPDDLPVIRKLLRHENWKVRTQAAICLGRLGTKADIPRLTHAAGDQEWWVRLRAANALASLPTMTPKRLEKIAKEHQNFFGADIIDKVRLEKEAYG